MVFSLRGWADTPVELAKKKEAATAAFRAKKYDVACPQFADVVRANPYDAWGWNDLALCSIRLEAFDDAMAALRKAKALEAVVGDEALQTAMRTNEQLLHTRVLAGKRWTEAQAKLVLQLTPEAQVDCALLERVHAQAPAALEGPGWRQLASCFTRASEISRALLQAQAMGTPPGEVPAIEWSLASEPADWKQRCEPLDGAACGRTWLLCRKMTDDAPGTKAVGFAVIDAATLRKWKREPPFENATLGANVSSSDVRCAVPDWPMGAVGLERSAERDLHFDPCTQTFLRWTTHESCEGIESSVTEQHFEVTAPR